MSNSELKGKLLLQAVKEYGCGEYSDKPLTEKTKKDRRLLGANLTRFFEANGWLFNEEIARDWIESKKKYTLKGELETHQSSIARYIAQIRAFNSYCVRRRYLTVNFCQWIAKPPEELKPHLDLSHDTLLKTISLGVQPGKYDKARSLKIKKEGEAALLFMLFTSRRSGEMTGLKGKDIHLSAAEPKYYVRVKGGKFLDFPIPENLIIMMQERQNKDKVFEVTPKATIEYLRNGLRKLGIPEEVASKADNHTLRKAFAKERYRNGDSVEEIADAMNDTVEVVRKHYLGRDLKKMKQTVNNTKVSKGSIGVTEIIKDIRKYIEMAIVGDERFNPLAAEQALSIEKLLKN